MTNPKLEITDLTTGTLDGYGIFDILMRTNKAHLEEEYKQNRIRGPEYSTVYLGSLESITRASLEFLIQREKVALEALLLKQQIILAEVAVVKANAEVCLIASQQDKIIAEISLITAQADLAVQEKDKLTAEISLITAQATLATKQSGKITTEEALISAQTALALQQKTNLSVEEQVLVAQACKLQAEYDAIIAGGLKTAQETALLTQKVITEKAQTSSVSVDPDSVVGKQKALYAAQTEGFKRDAEQKAATIMVSTWNTRRLSDAEQVPSAEAKITDEHIGQAVGKMLTGIGS